MKIDLTYKEANLITAILWELAREGAHVIGGQELLWRLTDKGSDLCASALDKLEDACEADNEKTGKDRDLSGAPKGTIQDARWTP